MAICIVLMAHRPHPSIRPYKVQRYCEKYRYLSVELQQQTGIPIPIILAIAGLETDWGNSELARKANNHFGLKTKSDWSGPTYCKETWEYWGNYPERSTECFRKYPLIRESYQDFGRFLKTRHYYNYLQSLSKTDYRSWAETLEWGAYATDPEYAEKLQRIIWEYELSAP